MSVASSIVNRARQQQTVAPTVAGQAPVTQTPGGVFGNIDPNRYQSSAGPAGAAGPGGGGANSNSIMMSMGPTGGGGRFDPSAIPGIEEFQRYEDAAYARAQGRMDPRFAEQNRAATQQLINQGIDPTSEAGRRFLENTAQAQNDAYNQAQYGAMGEGRAAQQQAFGQANAIDQLTLQDLISQRSSGAQMHAANVGAGASRYGTDMQRYLGGLQSELGFGQLNERGRQFDINDVFRSGQQDLLMLQSLFGMGGDLDQNAAQNFAANQGANQNWFNNIGAMLNQATGGIFTPVDVTGAANAQTGAGRGQDAFSLGLLNLLGGGG